MYVYFLRLRWQRAGLWYPSSRVQTRPKPQDFQGEKILSTPSFGGEVKPPVSCRRSLNLRGSRNLGKITTGHLSRPQFHLSLLGSLASLRTQRHVAAKVGTSKGGGKQWQNYPQELAQDAVCQEPYRFRNRALAPAGPASRAEY